MKEKIKIDFIYWLRWIAVLPGALVFASLMIFPLHWMLYFTFAKGETISGVDIKPIELFLTPFVFTIAFILSGYNIAPKYKFQTSIALVILLLIFYIAAFILPFFQFQLRSVSGLIGLFLGLYATWRKSRCNPSS